jgi:tRNA threonylcarbamoyladenosine biosynthesis protein TsaB
MRILALETSSMIGSVAALENDRLLGQTAFDPQLRSAQSFAPAMAQQLAAVAWRPQDVELVAVTVGPGSFTGLRVGVTAAKTFAYATGAQVLGVNTLHVIAAQAPGDWQQIHVVLDAQRQQLFAAAYARQGERLDEVAATRIADHGPWLDALVPGTTVTGAGLTRLRERLPAGVVVVDERCWAPQATTVGRLAHLEYRSGKRDDLWKLVPRYYRKSAAEEKFEHTAGGPER